MISNLSRHDKVAAMVDQFDGKVIPVQTLVGFPFLHKFPQARRHALVTHDARRAEAVGNAFAALAGRGVRRLGDAT